VATERVPQRHRAVERVAADFDEELRQETN